MINALNIKNFGKIMIDTLESESGRNFVKNIFPVDVVNDKAIEFIKAKKAFTGAETDIIAVANPNLLPYTKRKVFGGALSDSAQLYLALLRPDKIKYVEHEHFDVFEAIAIAAHPECFTAELVENYKKCKSAAQDAMQEIVIKLSEITYKEEQENERN